MNKSMLLRARCSAAAVFTPRSSSTCWHARSLSIPRAADPKQSAKVTEEVGNPWSQPGYMGAVVSQLPEQQQAAAFASIAAGIAAGGREGVLHGCLVYAAKGCKPLLV